MKTANMILCFIRKRHGSLKQEKNWEKTEDTGKIERNKTLKIGAIALGVILVIASLVVTYVKYSQSAFSQDRVSVKIDGPMQVNGSDDLKYTITFKNNNRADPEIMPNCLSIIRKFSSLQMAKI